MTLASLLNALRCGTASPAEIEDLDRRLFCLGAAACAGGLIARPTLVDMAPRQLPLDLDAEYAFWRCALR